MLENNGHEGDGDGGGGAAGGGGWWLRTIE